MCNFATFDFLTLRVFACIISLNICRHLSLVYFKRIIDSLALRWSITSGQLPWTFTRLNEYIVFDVRAILWQSIKNSILMLTSLILIVIDVFFYRLLIFWVWFVIKYLFVLSFQIRSFEGRKKLDTLTVRLLLSCFNFLHIFIIYLL